MPRRPASDPGSRRRRCRARAHRGPSQAPPSARTPSRGGQACTAAPATHDPRLFHPAAEQHHSLQPKPRDARAGHAPARPRRASTPAAGRPSARPRQPARPVPCRGLKRPVNTIRGDDNPGRGPAASPTTGDTPGRDPRGSRRAARRRARPDRARRSGPRARPPRPSPPTAAPPPGVAVVLTGDQRDASRQRRRGRPPRAEHVRVHDIGTAKTRLQPRHEGRIAMPLQIHGGAHDLRLDAMRARQLHARRRRDTRKQPHPVPRAGPGHARPATTTAARPRLQLRHHPPHQHGTNPTTPSHAPTTLSAATTTGRTSTASSAHWRAGRRRASRRRTLTSKTGSAWRPNVAGMSTISPIVPLPRRPHRASTSSATRPASSATPSTRTDGNLTHVEPRLGDDSIMSTEPREAGDGGARIPARLRAPALRRRRRRPPRPREGGGPRVVIAPRDTDHGSCDDAAKDPEGNIWYAGIRSSTEPGPARFQQQADAFP